jgi:hypothetical protein
MNLDDDVLDQIDEELELDLTDEWLASALTAPAVSAGAHAAALGETRWSGAST